MLTIQKQTFKISILNQVILWVGAEFGPVMLTVYSIQSPFFTYQRIIVSTRGRDMIARIKAVKAFIFYQNSGNAVVLRAFS
jgi:hypothetical protein